MNLRFASGSVTPGEAAQEQRLGVHVDERDVVVAAEQADDLLGLARAHQAVIDEDAGQLLADRLVDQHRRDRRIDPARQAADHPALADLRADLGDLGLAELGHRPVAGQPADVAREIGDQLAAVGGVDDLGMELHAVEAARLVGDDRVGRAVGRSRRGVKPGGERVDLVAVAHPHLVPLALAPTARRTARSGALTSMKALPNSPPSPEIDDVAAELRGHHLLAVADAEHRHARRRRSAAATRGLSSSVTEAGPPERMMPLRPQPVERRRRRTGRARSRYRRPPRARGGRSAGLPGCRNRR